MSRWRLTWVARGVINPAPVQVAGLGNVTQIAAGFRRSRCLAASWARSGDDPAAHARQA